MKKITFHPPLVLTQVVTITLLALAFPILNTYCASSLTIPSFGQIVPLGTLLDARSVTFLPGSSVFHRGFKPPPDSIDKRQSYSSEFHVHQLNSTYTKFDPRDYSRALILSILSEQVAVEGSWRYLVEEPKGHSVRCKTELKRKWRKKYHEKLRIEELHSPMGATYFTMPHSVAHNFSLEELLTKENENATHFVVGISYGNHIAAVFEDRATLRKYGLRRAAVSDQSHRRTEAGDGAQERQVIDGDQQQPHQGSDEPENDSVEEITLSHLEKSAINGKHDHTVVRLYTDRPLEGEDAPTTAEQREKYFYDFNDNTEENVVPLLYELMPLSVLVTFLNGNQTIRQYLSVKWGLERFVGDPYIESYRMLPIYREFDKVAIAQFKTREIMTMLIDLDLERYLPNRRENLEKITGLHQKFENSLEEFKGRLRGLLTDFRWGKLMHDTFEEGLLTTLREYRQGDYAPDKFERILSTEFKDLKTAIRLERLERAVGNLYTNVEELLTMAT